MSRPAFEAECLGCGRAELADTQRQLQAVRQQVTKAAADRRALDAELVELRVRASGSRRPLKSYLNYIRKSTRD